MRSTICGVTALTIAALITGCAQPPARQSAGVSRAPLRIPTQTTARLPRPQVLIASTPAVSDYDRDHDSDRWRVDVPEPPPLADRSVVARAARPTGLQPGVGLAPAVGVTSVRYAPPAMQARPAGVLSITQVGLEPAATGPDTTTEAVDSRQLEPRSRPRRTIAPRVGGLVYPNEDLAVGGGAGRNSVGWGGFAGVEYLPPIRLPWVTGSLFAMGELGLDRQFTVTGGTRFYLSHPDRSLAIQHRDEGVGSRPFPGGFSITP